MPSWNGNSGGVDWTLTLERDVLLPSRLVAGTVRVTAQKAVQARALLVTLKGVEHWVYETTTTDGQGHTRTERHTGSHDLPAEPVLVSGAVSLAQGESRELAFQLPTPQLGPPTIIAQMVRVDWSVEAKLDKEGGFDSSLEVPVIVAQPVALLRAGVVRVEQFALYPSADAADGKLAGSMSLDPLPLVAGTTFTGKIILRPSGSVNVRSVRAEVRVHTKATVSGGLSEVITAWAAQLGGPGTVSGETVYDISGSLPITTPPTAETPHGKVWSELVLVLDVAWARDPNLRRDITIASTGEL
jgi:hypothetical protein